MLRQYQADTFASNAKQLLSGAWGVPQGLTPSFVVRTLPLVQLLNSLTYSFASSVFQLTNADANTVLAVTIASQLPAIPH